MAAKKREEIMSDESIIDLYFARDEDAIFETDKKYGNYLMTVAMNILKNDFDSRTCLNDTYLRAWNSIPPTRPRMLKAFLAKIMRGRALNVYEYAKRGRRVPQDICHPFDEMDEFIADGHEGDSERIAQIISEYLNGVSERRLYVFVSRYFYAKPIADIARALSVSVSTVDKEIANIKSELREKLAEEGIKV